MNKKEALNAFDGAKSFDISSVNELTKKIQSLKDNPKGDALEQLIELKSSIEMLIAIMPKMKTMLNPYITKVNQGIAELTKKRNDEKQ